MKKINGLTLLFGSICIAFMILSCQKENAPEIIGKSTELSAYEQYVEDVNSGRIDSSAFIYTSDGGSIYISWYIKTGEISENLTFSVTEPSICKLDKDGQKEWQFYYGGPMERCSFGRLIQLKDKSIVFGASKSNIMDQSHLSYLVKLDEDGQMLMEAELPCNLGQFISQSSDNGYIVLGSVDSIVSIEYNDDFGYIENIVKEYDYRLIKTTSSGIVEWNKRHGEIGIKEFGNSIIQTEDGGYLVAVMHLSDNFGTTGYTTIVKTDQYGNFLRRTEIGNDIILNDIISANDGGYLLTSLNENINPFNRNLVLTKLDNSGDIEWQKIHQVEAQTRDEGPGPVSNVGVHRDLRVLKLLNSAYFVVEQGIDYFSHSSIHKFNNSGELIE